MRKFSTLIAVTLMVSLAACGGSSKKPGTTTTPTTGGTSAKKKSLYDRLGGLDAIKQVIADFVGNVAADERINGRFANADIEHLKTMLVEQVCEATGGPCKYSGKDMVTAHTGMNLTDDEFNALVEDLVTTLDKFRVAQAEKDELLGALGGMKGDIVGK